MKDTKVHKHSPAPSIDSEQKQHNGLLYQCPMKCEGEKVYNAPGNCLVCGMHLVPLMENNKHVEHHHAHDHNAPFPGTGNYYCPMHCEGDKTYEKSGDCPVCGMHLVKLETKNPTDVVYTCPMHPEIRQNGPGSCPICGMVLVPEKGAVTSEEEMAYKQMARKFWIALALSIPVFVIAMSDFFSFLHLDLIASKATWGWVQFVLASPVLFYSSRSFFKRGWGSIRR